MTARNITKADIETLAAEIRDSAKYRDTGIPQETLEDLIARELPAHPRLKELRHAVKKKLHNIVAPYLGDPDYAQAEAELKDVFQQGGGQIEQFCLRMLNAHASTRERVPIMAEFYSRLFAVTGIPSSILDLACGLNPFALPWMNLPEETSYRVYDLHRPRICLIDEFLRNLGRPDCAHNQDILTNPPQVQADLALFFKEAHRFEQRARGCNRDFWISLPVKKIAVSLPTSSLSGRHDKTGQHRRLVYDAITGLDWPVQELVFPTEIVFILQKAYE